MTSEDFEVLLSFPVVRQSRIEWIEHGVPQGCGSVGGIFVDDRNGKLIPSVAEMIVRFTGKGFSKLAEWERRLKADPQILDTLIWTR